MFRPSRNVCRHIGRWCMQWDTRGSSRSTCARTATQRPRIEHSIHSPSPRTDDVQSKRRTQQHTRGTYASTHNLHYRTTVTLQYRTTVTLHYRTTVTLHYRTTVTLQYRTTVTLQYRTSHVTVQNYSHITLQNHSA